MNVLPAYFAKRKTYKLEVTVEYRFILCYFFFSVSENISDIQNHIGKYRKWPSAMQRTYAKLSALGDR